MHNPKISVIIPTYNRSRYVVESIDSVLGQTYLNYEIIVVDDGSTDNTREVLQPYLSRITCIFQENKGVSAARNAGIKAARGEWLAFLDSDDVWLPGKLARQIADINQHRDLDLHICNAAFIDGGASRDMFLLRGLGRREWHTILLTEPFVHLLRFKYAYLPCVIHKRKALYFDEEMSILEDLHYLARVALNSRRWMLRNEQLVRCLRRNENPAISLTQRKKNDLQDSRRVNEVLYDKLEEYIVTELMTDKYLLPVNINRSHTYFDYAIKCPDQTEARKYLYRGLKSHWSSRNHLKYLVYYLRSWARQIGSST